MTNNFNIPTSRDRNAAGGSLALAVLTDADLDAISGGDDSKSWRNDYHYCANGTVNGSGGGGLYPLYLKCK